MLGKGWTTLVTTGLGAGQKRAQGAHLRGVGDVRISTDKQAQEGISLDAQRDKLTQYCALYEIKLIAIQVDDVYTAKSLRRPDLTAALRSLERDTCPISANGCTWFDPAVRSVLADGDRFSRASIFLLG